MIAVLAGCTDHGAAPEPAAPPGPAPVSFAAEIQPIFDANCILCHGAGGNGGLDLRAPGSRGNLVGAASATYTGVRVQPGEPDDSILYLKLSGAAGVGDRMPPTGALPAPTLELVRRWIAEGATDN